MYPGVVELAQWMLSRAGEELFAGAKQALLVSVGLAPEESQERRQLLDEYGKLIDQRLASKVLHRLDEDRLAALKGGLAQLRAASKTELRREYLANAANTFFTITSIPDVGTTAGIDNRQLKAIASLGIAGIHVHFDERLDDVASSVALAVRLHRETAVLWLGHDVVDRLSAVYPTDLDDSATGPPGLMEPRLEVPASPGALHREHVKDALYNATGRVKLVGLDLSAADLTGLDLRNVDFRNADLTGADLSSSQLGDPGFWALSQADLRSANLAGAVLVEADLSRCRVDDAILTKAVVDRAILDKARLDGADMSEASLVGAQLVHVQAWRTLLLGANLQSANLEKADLTGATLTGARLTGATLQRAVMEKVHAAGVDLSAATATQMTITKGVWREVDFSGSNISGSMIRGADLEGAVMRGTNAQNCGLADLDLRRVDLEDADLRGATYNRRTLWPTGVVPVARGAELNPYL